MPTLEQTVNEKYELEAQRFIAKHDKLYEAVAGSPMFNQHTRSFGVMDAVNIGKQIEMFKSYETYVNENSGASALGTLPQISMDLIGAIYGLSVAPILSSMQTIDEQTGIIYFKQVVAQGYTASGDTNGISAGDVTVDALTGWNKAVDNYMSEKQTRTFNFAATTGQTLYNTVGGTSGGAVIVVRPNVMMNVTIKVGSTTYTGVIINPTGSSATGTLMVSGLSVSGTYTYATGVLTMTFGSAPAITDTIAITYMIDFEKAADIPSVEFSLTSDSVIAEIMGLKEMIGTFKSFQFNKRFGKTASDEALADLAGHLAAAESSKIIRAYIILANSNLTSGGAVDSITWYKGRPSGVSEFEHRQAFLYTLAAADAKIGKRAGRGFANRYIAGYGACQYLMAQNGFKPAAPNVGVGPHLFGYINGAPIIRTDTREGLGDNQIVAAYVNPTSPFEAPVVDATYMPVFLTNTMQVSNNPFQNQRAIATWKAIKPVVKQFTQLIELQDGVDPSDSLAVIAVNTAT